MSNLSIFTFQSDKSIRVEVVKNEPYFCLLDITKALNIKNTNIGRFKLKKAGLHKMYVRSGGQKRELTFISEQNLYRLIFRSNKEEAVIFQDWVFDIVLPSIRKTGSYLDAATTQNIKTLCSHMFWLNEWWERYEPAFCVLSPELAAYAHDHFNDGFFVAGLVDNHLNIFKKNSIR